MDRRRSVRLQSNIRTEFSLAADMSSGMFKAYGYLRATQDIDFVVKQEEQFKIIQFMEGKEANEDT